MIGLVDNIRATGIATRLGEEELRALTGVEDEQSATLNTMSRQTVDALTRRRRVSANPADDPSGQALSLTSRY